jgi:hypothetical protein
MATLTSRPKLRPACLNGLKNKLLWKMKKLLPGYRKVSQDNW